MTMSTRPFIVVLGAGLLATGLTTSARHGASPLPPLVSDDRGNRLIRVSYRRSPR